MRGTFGLPIALAREDLTKLALEVVLAVLVGRQRRALGIGRLRTAAGDESAVIEPFQPERDADAETFLVKDCFSGGSCVSQGPLNVVCVGRG